MRRSLLALVGIVLLTPTARPAEPAAIERGRKALLEQSYIPPSWTMSAYQNAWKRWPGVTEKSADYDAAFRDHYGLHPAPYPNGQLPMGLRTATALVFKGINVDCLVCHGGSIAGTSYVGLGNASLDVQALFEDLAAADGRSPKLPFTFSNVRGTSEAGAMAVFLLGYRDPDLSLHRHWQDLGLKDDMCEDVPAWWALKKKQTMYHTGASNAHSVRSKMQFMMTPLVTRADFDRHEAAFRDIEEYIRSLEPPKYPLPIDRVLAAKGETVFGDNCASCHGTYGAKWTYPNKVIALDKIGTDRKRFEGVSAAFGNYYNQTWFAKEKKGWFTDEYLVRPTAGYQAPPLDGVWATAPYLHNGSVPTVYHLLKSSSRPKVFARSYRTDLDAYDPVKLGWKFDEPKGTAHLKLSAVDERKVYDTTQPGRGNGGHTFGDDLSEGERLAVIEYLKTL